MASELRVNTINSRTGFGTITVSETGQDLVGITTIENLTAENTLVGAAASFTGNVSVGGVLTYEDVTNIDSVGLITARQGIEIGARPGVAASISVDGNMVVSGVSTFGGTANFGGNVIATSLYTSDSIIHRGETADNTKIRFPSDDTVTVETDGSERIRINSSGNIQINNTNCEKRFSVRETSTTSGVYYNAAIGGASHLAGYAVGIGFDPEGSNARYKAGIVAEGTGDGYSRAKLHFLLDSANDSGEATLSESRLTITDAGKVGINDTAPERTMDVKGSNCMIQLEGTGGNGRQYSLCSSDDATGSAVDGGPSGTFAIYDDTAGSARLRIDKDGDTHILGICTAKAFVSSQGQTSHRNLIHNGAFNIAQRDTSHGSSGFRTVDRWRMSAHGASTTLTQSQTDITSGAPFDLGFRHVYKITNAGQNANNQAYCYMMHSMEAQDIAQSGWDYTSTSSYITLSFWIKASVAQTYLLTLHAPDSSTLQEWNHLITCAANTWKKVILKIPGNSDISVNNDSGIGFQFILAAYLGNHYTSGSTVDQWVDHAGFTSRPDMGATWWATSDSTIEITGVQLEAGEAVTPFEHRTYGDDLLICQRYYQQIATSGDHVMWGFGRAEGNTARVQIPLSVPLRASPTLTCDANRSVKYDATMVQSTTTPNVFKWTDGGTSMTINFPSGGTLTHNNVYIVTSDSGSTGLQMSAEI